MEATEETVRKARLQLAACLDGQGFWTRIYRCVEFPELTKVMRGPRGKSKEMLSENLFVNGAEVPMDPRKIAFAIRQARTSPPTPRHDA